MIPQARSRFLAVLAFVWLLSSFAAAQERTLTVEGEAAPEAGQSAISVRQLAIEDGMRRALEISLGAFISSETTVENFELVKDAITKRAQGFARVDQILEERTLPSGRYVVKLSVVVSSGKIVSKLREVIKGFNDPRVAVFLDERIDGRVAPGLAASTALSKSLIDAGYRVLDQKQLETQIKREELQAASSSPAALATIAARVKVDLILVGSARSSRVQNPPADISNAGFLSVQSVLELRFVDALTAQVIWTDQFEGADYDLTIDTASSKSFRKTALNAVNPAMNRLAAWIQGNDSRAAPVYLVKVEGFDSFGAFNAFVQQLSTLEGVGQVQARDFDVAGSVVEVQFQGKSEALALLLEKLGLKVVGLSGREIRCRK